MGGGSQEYEDPSVQDGGTSSANVLRAVYHPHRGRSNTRPLSPLSSTDLDDDLVLTACHFFTGRPLKAPPQDVTQETSKITSLRRWNLVQRLRQDLWHAWSIRYLQSLDARHKWHLKHRNIRVGDVVLVRGEML